jgi:hypothetical protein
MARSVDDVKVVPCKIGAAQSSCARAGFDAVEPPWRRAAPMASKMVAAIASPCLDTPKAETALCADQDHGQRRIGSDQQADVKHAQPRDEHPLVADAVS